MPISQRLMEKLWFFYPVENNLEESVWNNFQDMLFSEQGRHTQSSTYVTPPFI